MKIDYTRGKELAEEHWGYVEALLKAHCVRDDELRMIGFHYKSSFVHGWGHGIEDAMQSMEVGFDLGNVPAIDPTVPLDGVLYGPTEDDGVEN